MDAKAASRNCWMNASWTREFLNGLFRGWRSSWIRSSMSLSARNRLSMPIRWCKACFRILITRTLSRLPTTSNSKRQEGHEEVLVVIRYKDRDNQNVVKTDYDLSNASPETQMSEFARVAKAEQRIEECLGRAKSEAGLAVYQVCNWKGWHHHQTLSLIATSFLVTEACRGKNGHRQSRFSRRDKSKTAEISDLESVNCALRQGRWQTDRKVDCSEWFRNSAS